MKIKYIKNAVIGHTYLGTSDYGYLTAIVGAEHDSGTTGFGTHDLRYPPYGIDYITQILKVLEVDSWESLKGTYCRIKRFDDDTMAIGHIINDNWFYPEGVAKNYKDNQQGE